MSWRDAPGLSPPEGYSDIYLVKTNSLGDTLWTRTYGGSYEDEAYSAQQMADGGYIVVGGIGYFGEGSGDFYLVKTNSQGDTLWTRTYGGRNSDLGHSVQQTADGGYIVAGSTRSSGAGGLDFYLVKTGPDQLESEPVRVSVASQCTLYPNWPNPFNPSTQITYALPKSTRVTLTVFNLLGEKISTLADEIQPAGTHTFSFDGSGLASGVYLYRLQTDGFSQTRKMILLK